MNAFRFFLLCGLVFYLLIHFFMIYVAHKDMSESLKQLHDKLDKLLEKKEK